ncbi:MAG: alpha/beta hydrolase [Clostridia bacterium]|nr:alpha/beta hydrolase [Clostridia bacterium]
MDIKHGLWNGFECHEFIFDGQPSRVVIPEAKTEKPSLLIKTEYWNAFPQTEIELLKQGFYLSFIENENRWGKESDLDRKAEFVKFVTEKYGLQSKCVPVGMSCGGLIAIKFAAKYPELVACLYVDAPVLNYMSCPCGFGIGDSCCEDFPEFFESLGLKNISELICYLDMPMHKLPILVENRTPVIIVAGGSDKTVPYEENGLMLEKAYKENGIDIAVYVKPDCGHHPHGLENPTPVVEFIKKYGKTK